MLFPREVTGFSSDVESVDRVPNDPDDPIVAREIETLRREIAELEARARRRTVYPDTGPPSVPSWREDEDDESDPSTCATQQLPIHHHPGISLTDPSPASDPADSVALNGCDPLPTVYFFTNEFNKLFTCDLSNGEFEEITDIIEVEVENGEGATNRFFQNGEWLHEKGASDQSRRNGVQPPEEETRDSRKAFLSVKTLRRILNAKESIFKYGIFVPRNDKDADSFPEHARWASGRTLEWMRLQDQGTFGRNWDWTRVQRKFPSYLKRDVGHVFFVYDFKYSGEHRVTSKPCDLYRHLRPHCPRRIGQIVPHLCRRGIMEHSAIRRPPSLPEIRYRLWHFCAPAKKLQ
jgi:hypothetical protein